MNEIKHVDGVPFELCDDKVTLHTKDKKGNKVILSCLRAINQYGRNVLLYEVHEVTGDITLHRDKTKALERTIIAEAEKALLFQDTE